MEKAHEGRCPLCAFLFAILVCFCLSGTISARQTDSLSVLFIGDLMQHKSQIDAARLPGGGYDYAECFRYVKPEFGKNDLVIANLEVTLAGKPYTGYPGFSAPDEYLYAVRNAGIDVLVTSNNHCLDKGKRGLERTIGLLDSLRIPHVGTYRNRRERLENYPLLVEKNGFRLALLSYTYGTNGIPVQLPNVVNYIDREQIRKDILKARLMKPDVIIAYMHWGIEYQSLPRKEERKLAEWLLELGVDHVIGTHPHVIQPIEIVEDSLTPERHVVAYSLGNFVSGMVAPQTDGGLALKLRFHRAASGNVRLTSCDYSFVWTSRPTLSGQKNYCIYPAGVEAGLLNSIEQSRMDRYLKVARKLFSESVFSIKESFFERK